MKNKTLADWAQDSIQVQDACNSSGVAQSLARLFIDLGDLVGRDTDERNRHDTVKLFIAKLADLAGLEYKYPFDAEKRLLAFIDSELAKDIEVKTL